MNGEVIKRKLTKKIRVGTIYIGGDAPITVQSMTNTKTEDIKSTVEQILKLEECGCDIIRVAVTNIESAEAIKSIKKNIHIPIVADIQFDYRLAIESVKNGADKIRINPGNIGDRQKLIEVVKALKYYGLPLRVGVNSGSLKKELLNKYGMPTAEALVESALEEINILEDLDFQDIVVSIKSSDVITTIKAYELISQKVNYPLHLGVTEAGTLIKSTVKSSVGIGTLLYKGIGDTIRVSITGDPVEEVKVGIELLKSLNLKKSGIDLISCPTCARCNVNLISIAKEIEQRLSNIKEPLKVAVMGCAVNGPGEAKEADIGLAGGNKSFVLFKKGKIERTVGENEAVEVLIQEIKELLKKSKSI
ncbi:flavodoxin-dependent (E)-4-hydroxy-3-methylbut-2-enyl-diphosphate synthase [Thermovenabulum gondwanense]|uniref:4-hydroxy-3-methylbut-2-en-1-yl diphosphate synthase (flavodoxin) n=1 Tax=Thermovenabulum gondwanense TaxID=520767 RepID=A0A162MG85_9FIRM|nr:flavodoxin-dependent (E)-4-hydroxy-3-methylbut-2-enyl-diphosphate synthase [Thermovenabulum gondwanense]KYO65776.1 4-hydroxy-3-methylbut-2-en-1-yl diphosphate synthase (flavodoxin) [Thermovenabulum gondwanense]